MNYLVVSNVFIDTLPRSDALGSIYQTKAFDAISIGDSPHGGPTETTNLLERSRRLPELINRPANNYGFSHKHQNTSNQSASATKTFTSPLR